MLFNGSSNYWRMNKAIRSGAPFTMHVWGKSTDVTTTQTILGIWDASASNQYFLLYVVVSDIALNARSVSSNIVSAAGSGDLVNNEWFSGTCTATSTSSRAVYRRGVAKATDSNTVAPTGLDRTTFGRSDNTAPGSYFSGDIGLSVIWSAALTDQEVQMLGQSPGLHPWFLASRVGNLVLLRDNLGASPNETHPSGKIDGLSFAGSGSASTSSPPVCHPHAGNCMLMAA